MEFDNMDVKNNIILAMDLMDLKEAERVCESINEKEFVNQLTSTLTLLKSDIH